MFVFKKLLTPFLLPPGVFVLLSILWGAGYLFKKKVKPGMMLVLLGCTMWLLAIAPTSGFLLKGLEAGIAQPKQIKGDVLILLGGGTYDKVPDVTGVGFPRDETLARIITAVRLYHRLGIPILVSGGRVYSSVRSEAEIVRRFLVDLAVPPERIIIEDQSRDTFENAFYSVRLCKKNNYRKPILITSAFHMKRAVLNFQKAGMAVVPFPAAYKTWQNRGYGWNDYLPNSFEDTHAAVKEYLGLIYTRLFL